MQSKKHKYSIFLRDIVPPFLTFLALVGTTYYASRSINIAKDALINSQEILAITRNQVGTNLRPLITVNSVLYNNGNLKPKIIIANNGKIEAINILVQIIRRQFDGKEFVGASWTSSDQHVFNQLMTFEFKEIPLPDEYIINPEFNTLELRLYYMRNFDKQVYSNRTFYFYGPEEADFKGWINIQQVKTNPGYSKMIEEVLKLPKELLSDKEKMIMEDGLYDL